MKLAKLTLFAFALAIAVEGTPHVSYAQDRGGEAVERNSAAEKENAKMDQQNRDFVKHENERPATDKDYRQTKEYQAMPAEKQREVDRAVERMNAAIEHVREQKARENAPAPSPSPSYSMHAAPRDR